MTSEVLCFHCGARNHVPEGWGRLSGKCKNCGTALLSTVRGVAPEPKSNHRSSTSSGLASPSLFKLLAVLVIIGMLYLSFVGWRNKETVLSMLEQLGVLSSTVGQYIESTLPKRPPEQEKSLTEELPPQKEPPPTKKLPPSVKQRPGVVWNKTLLLPQAPFKVETDYGADYYIKLVDAETNDDAMAIYVVGGQDLEVLVPLGYYKMRYAYGKIWRGEQHLFGPGNLTTVEEALENFDFNMSYGGFNGYTVKLIPRIAGNLPTRYIARDDF